MVDDGQALRGAIAEGLTHDIRVGDGITVVTEANGASAGKLRHFRQLQPVASLGHTAYGQDIDHALVAGTGYRPAR